MLSARRISRRVLIALSVVAVSAALAYGVSCPIDNSSAYFTGATRVDSASGKLLKKYRCARGHEFWSVD
jgi:hypothetical protein